VLPLARGKKSFVRTHLGGAAFLRLWGHCGRRRPGAAGA
jgi:hypothetical protein